MPLLEGAEDQGAVGAGERLVLDGVGGGQQRPSPEPVDDEVRELPRQDGVDRVDGTLLLATAYGVDGDLEPHPGLAHLEHLAHELDVGLGEAAVTGGRALAGREAEPVLPRPQHSRGQPGPVGQDTDAEATRCSGVHDASTIHLVQPLYNVWK